MKNFGKIVFALSLAAPVAAYAQINEGDTLGTTEEDIRSSLEAQGYAISEFEMEDGEIEVEASLNGEEFEIEVSPETGKVLEIAAEESDDDSNDDDDESDDS